MCGYENTRPRLRRAERTPGIPECHRRGLGGWPLTEDDFRGAVVPGRDHGGVVLVVESGAPKVDELDQVRHGHALRVLLRRWHDSETIREG
eukprot:1617626-Pyramimonas_sp.AAC.1